VYPVLLKEPDRMRPTNRIYYPEIDGLRALAVLSVLFFHTDIKLLPGGFTGVDVFFVISGYLITRNIRDDILKGRFSFQRFYIRRLRRLFPAILFTLCLTMTLGTLLFSPSHLERLGKSAVFAIASLSNFFFWSESGYFDTSSEFKPLLHFWSLAVEEQFYLIWPTFLLIMLRLKKAWVMMGLVFISIISLAGSEYMIKQDPAAVFFLTPFRIFEFGIGAGCVWLTDIRQQNWQKEIGLLTGLCLMFYSMLFFDRDTLFPGASALIPCIGAALVIINGEAPIVGLVLRNRVAVRIGVISYSLYLIHWPILVFYQYWSFNPSSFPEKLGLIALSLLLAEFMFRYIEQPFQFKQTGNEKNTQARFLIAVSAIATLLVLPSIHAWKYHGWEWRIPNYDNSLQNEVTSPCRNLIIGKQFEKRCNFGNETSGPATVLLIGDSHAEQLMPGLDYLGKKLHLKIHAWTHPGCPPVWGTYKNFGKNNIPSQESCKATVPKWEEEMVSGKYDIVILASRWMLLYESAEYGEFQLRRDLLVDRHHPELNVAASMEVFRTKLTETMQQIHLRDAKTIVFSQVPPLGKDIQDCNSIPSYLVADSMLQVRCNPKVEYQGIINRLKFTNDTIRRLASNDTMTVIPSDFMCDSNTRSCLTIYGGKLLYKDSNHLNVNGSLFLAKMIEDQFSEFISKK